MPLFIHEHVSVNVLVCVYVSVGMGKVEAMSVWVWARLKHPITVAMHKDVQFVKKNI